MRGRMTHTTFIQQQVSVLIWPECNNIIKMVDSPGLKIEFEFAATSYLLTTKNDNSHSVQQTSV
jgi:hypothetical protein